ncbi:four-carbon acid sugar kinase family protein, partial [Achromobacter xylosoxidans]|uniref:four-carbon acid sugar kinase family protein n=1 Tax=Alcaligenes xylosoxydans xylosoxydans TaxID=85698 RepID=UPI00375ABF6E
VALAGWRSLLFLAVPTPHQLERAGPLDAIGIAGAARGMAPDEITAELRAAGRFLAATGTRILHYKSCSTFDSAPHVGSIGAAVAELRRLMLNPLVPIVGGQPGIGRFCSFANLFARAGAAAEVHRIVRHPVLAGGGRTPIVVALRGRPLGGRGGGG